jgi:hypothetical protein
MFNIGSSSTQGFTEAAILDSFSERCPHYRKMSSLQKDIDIVVVA